MPFQPRNLAISAAAGSGKTFQLVHRYIGLLVLGFAPERIVALTFSRKAAGEMFDRVLHALAEAASSEEKAASLTSQLQLCYAIPHGKDIDRDSARRLLQQVIMNCHRVRIGTLDSFLVGIIQAFPFEFGINGDFKVLEGYPAQAAKQEALREVLLGLGSGDTKAGQSFINSFKQAVYGQEEKKFSETASRFIDNYHALFLESPNPELWGNERLIWGKNGCPWPQAHSYPEKEAGELQTFLSEQYTSVRQCEDFFAVLPNFHPVADWKKVKYLYCKLREIYSDLKNENAVLVLNRKKINLPPVACRAAALIVEYITGSFLSAHLEKTKALYEILNSYETVYRDSIRESGRLGFNDVAFLLNSHRLSDPENGIPGLTSEAGNTNRLYIDYRLDSHFDHWLLDEFQDTSTLQWHAVENLIDEVVQSTDGNRSFFYVGDVKQAIYGWRGGDPELFDWVQKKYGADQDGEPVIKRRPLARSWRSSQPVIEAVNLVFDQLPERGLDIDNHTSERWEANWNRHQTEKKALPGCAAFYSLPREKGQTIQDQEEARFQALLWILQQTEAVQRGFSVAALVRTNDQGRRLAEFLRRADMPSAFAGSFSLLDTPIIAAFVSFIKLAEHPADTYAWEHLKMSPLGVDMPTGKNPPSSLIQESIELIGREGFEAFIRHRLKKTNQQFTEFEFSRIKSLIQAGREFDAIGNRRTTDFIDFLGECEVEDPTMPEAVRIMTIHKAKGLQFNMVLLPALDRSSGINSVTPTGLYVERSETAERTPEWVLDLPRKDILKADSVLVETLQKLQNEAAYEELCNLYVAMTRAENSLYMIRTEPSSSTTSLHPSGIVAAGLDTGTPRKIKLGEITARELYTAGDLSWTEKAAPPDSGISPAESLKPISLPTPDRKRYLRETPSGDENIHISASLIFQPDNGNFADFGKAVHAMLCKVEWYNLNLELEPVFRKTRTEFDISEKTVTDAWAHFKQALSYPSIQTLLSRPKEGNVILWREKSFELILENSWISGCFDRVVIEIDANGKPSRAVLIDYKTSIIKSPEELEQAQKNYTPQMNSYCRALARMTGLSLRHIRPVLVFTGIGQVVEIRSEQAGNLLGF